MSSKNKKLSDFGYVVAGESLLLAHLLFKQGKEDQAIKVLAKAVRQSDFEQLAQAIDAVNQKAVVLASREKISEEAGEQQDGDGLAESLASILTEEETADEILDNEDDDLNEAESINEEAAPDDPMDALVKRPRGNSSRAARAAGNLRALVQAE